MRHACRDWYRSVFEGPNRSEVSPPGTRSHRHVVAALHGRNAHESDVLLVDEYFYDYNV